jgi:hypothetical protein
VQVVVPLLPVVTPEVPFEPLVLVAVDEPGTTLPPPHPSKAVVPAPMSQRRAWRRSVAK